MHDPSHIFDNLDALRRDGERLKKQSKASNKRTRSGETFARIPHDRGRRLYKKIDAAAWAILIELDWLILTSKGQNPIRLTNERLYSIGMSRNAKRKALRQLENAGVIKVERHERGIVLVTHLWFEIST
jgi:Fe-S cluster biosynthesis and repair protein YggX